MVTYERATLDRHDVRIGNIEDKLERIEALNKQIVLGLEKTLTVLENHKSRIERLEENK